MSETGKDDWERHWSAYQVSMRSNPAQTYRYRLLARLLGLSRGSAARLVDIGSGTGHFIAHLHHALPDVPKLGIEYSAMGVEVARAGVQSQNVAFQQVDLLLPVSVLPEYWNWATHAVCSEVLEHVDDPEKLLRNAATFLAPGCRFVVTVPGGPVTAFDYSIGHREHFTTATLRNLLETAGFSVETVAAVGFPFFNLYRLLALVRGKKLITDAKGEPSLLLRFVSSVFDILMRFDLPGSRLGWQIVAVARKPD